MDKDDGPSDPNTPSWAILTKDGFAATGPSLGGPSLGGPSLGGPSLGGSPSTSPSPLSGTSPSLTPAWGPSMATAAIVFLVGPDGRAGQSTENKNGRERKEGDAVLFKLGPPILSRQY